MTDAAPYYRPDLALVHHRGFGFHADACAPGIVTLLQPVRERGGLVVEFGCGSGLLTRYLVDAGLRVLATDASPAMLDLARTVVPDAEGLAALRLPDDPIPAADAIVGVGHPINYLPDADAIALALIAFADALRPGGVLAFDVCDFEWGELRRGQPNEGRVADDWAIVTRYELPTPDDYVRYITCFVPDADGRWRRDDEEHHNVLLDTTTLPALFAQHGVDVEVRESFGSEVLPRGLRTVVGRKRTG
ncbi:MAG: methyltransferase [Acidimicrobiia bacterium]